MIYYPPAGFYFKLGFTGITVANDAAFQEASGLSVEMGVEEFSEGGENRFKHRLPSVPKFQNLVLKRGAVPSGSQLYTWCKETFESGFSATIQPKTITLTMLNPNSDPMMIWDFINAWPVKWNFSDFKSQESVLAIETIEFAYQYFTRTR